MNWKWICQLESFLSWLSGVIPLKNWKIIFSLCSIYFSPFQYFQCYQCTGDFPLVPMFLKTLHIQMHIWSNEWSFTWIQIGKFWIRIDIQDCLATIWPKNIIKCHSRLVGCNETFATPFECQKYLYRKCGTLEHSFDDNWNVSAKACFKYQMEPLLQISNGYGWCHRFITSLYSHIVKWIAFISFDSISRSDTLSSIPINLNYFLKYL